MLHVDNPTDGSSVQGTVPIQVSVASPNMIESVLIRVDGGLWQAAAYDGTHYVYEWATSGIADKTVSIQAQATTYAKVGLGTDEPFDMPTQDRAIWIWESETYKLLLNPNSRYVLDTFAKDTDTFNSDPVTTFYLAVGTYGGMDILEDDPGKLRDFISWAHDQAYDQPHMTTLYPRVGLSDLSISAGTLNFDSKTTNYHVTVSNDVTSITATPTAAIQDSAITIEGQHVTSGSPSHDIALNEGDNMISMIVTGVKEETDAYTLQVTRSVFVDNVFQSSEDTYVY